MTSLFLLDAIMLITDFAEKFLLQPDFGFGARSHALTGGTATEKT
jgi:hypothetical protein